MKVMYISKAFEGNIGAEQHYKAILELCGKENVYTVDLRQLDAYEKPNYKAYGKYKNKLDRIIRWSQGNMMWLSNSIIKDILKIIGKFGAEIVYFEDSVFGSLAKKIKEYYPKIKVFSFYHDIKADLYKQWIKKTKGIGAIEWLIGIRQEKLNQKYCDLNIVFNKRDADLFYKIYGKYPEATIALSAPTVKISNQVKRKIVKPGEKKTLLFVGKKYGPNITGLNWFVKNVLPNLSTNLQIQIVGRGLECLRSEYTDKRIYVIGGVDSLISYYENADIVIAPLFDGGGMKSKTVEALSFGKIFVGTEESLFGFWEEMDDSIRMQGIYQCDTVEDWIKVLNGLAQDCVHKYNEKIHELFLERFSFETIKEQYRQILFEEAVE